MLALIKYNTFCPKTYVIKAYAIKIYATKVGVINVYATNGLCHWTHAI
jgi:hypothetical protein